MENEVTDNRQADHTVEEANHMISKYYEKSNMHIFSNRYLNGMNVMNSNI